MNEPVITNQIAVTKDNIQLVGGPLNIEIFSPDPEQNFFLTGVQIRVYGFDSLEDAPVVQLSALGGKLTDLITLTDDPDKEGRTFTFPAAHSFNRVQEGNPINLDILAPVNAGGYTIDVTLLGYYRVINT